MPRSSSSLTSKDLSKEVSFIHRFHGVRLQSRPTCNIPVSAALSAGASGAGKYCRALRARA